MLLIMAFVLSALASCSDNDEPQPEKDPNPGNENLISVKYYVDKPGMTGFSHHYGVNAYLNFMSSNNHEWLRDTPWFEKSSRIATGISNSMASSIDMAT